MSTLPAIRLSSFLRLANFLCRIRHCSQILCQTGFQINQNRPTSGPLRSKVLRAKAPPLLPRGHWLPTSLNRSAHLQPEKTGLPGFPAPHLTWTWQRKETPKRCSEIFAVKIPGSSHTATRRLTGGSQGSESEALTELAPLTPSPACLPSRLSLSPCLPAPHPEKCFALRNDHTPHKRRLGRSSLQPHPQDQLGPNKAGKKGDHTPLLSGEANLPFFSHAQSRPNPQSTPREAHAHKLGSAC